MTSSILENESDGHVAVLIVALNMLHAAKNFLQTLKSAIEVRQLALQREKKRQERIRTPSEIKLRMAGPGYHELEVFERACDLSTVISYVCVYFATFFWTV